MRITEDEKKVVVMQFDSLCKTALANTVKNYYTCKTVRMKNEDYYDYMKNCSVCDKYFHKQYIVEAGGIPVVIENRRIFSLLMKLEKNRRKIILLYYFAELSDKDISYILKIPRATVQYRRTKALDELRNIIRR